MFQCLGLLVRVIRTALRSRRDLALENVTLRYQLAVLARSTRRRRLRPIDRLALSWLTRLWSGWRSAPPHWIPGATPTIGGKQSAPLTIMPM
jgi:hypothetical protein